MPRYYFDVRQGDQSYRDVEGLELVGVEEAWEEAAGIIADRVKDVFIKGDRRKTCQPIGVEVREGSGIAISLQVSFATDRLESG